MTNTIPWSRRDGRLRATQRWQLALAAVTLRLASRRRAAGAGGQLDDTRALASLAPPTDEVSNALWRQADQLQPGWLMQHALRAYAWGRLLALKDGVAHDAAGLFDACLLHDLGLTPAAAHPPEGCFAVRGALRARSLALEAGATPARAHAIACAIARHLDLRVDAQEAGAEAHLLHAGTGLDAIGRRWREIAAPLREQVLARHPRQGMKRALCACMQHEAQAAPHTRLGLYTRRLGFLDLIARAPFDD